MANITIHKEGGAPSSTGAQQWDPFRTAREMLRWDPFREMSSFPLQLDQGFMPAFEVKETKDSYMFKADLPGVKESDIDITRTGNRITVSGKRESELEEQDDRYYTFERSYGTFSRSFTLPEGFDDEHIHAELKEGVLSLVVPKKPEAQPKKISLQGSFENKQKG